MNANVKSTRGRKPLKVKFPRGPFTVEKLFTLNDKANGGVIKCELTARNHIKRGLESGKLTRLATKAPSDTVGVKPNLYQLTADFNYNLNRKRTKDPVAAEAPAHALEPVAA